MIGKGEKGQLTIFFGLILTILLSLSLTLIEGARYSAMKLAIASTHQTVGNSLLSGYHNELFQRYGLLFFHSVDIEKQAVELMNKNWNKDTLGALFGVRDLLALEALQTQVEQVTLATDDVGAVLRRQCVACMEERYGITYFEQMLNALGSTQQLGLDEKKIKLPLEEGEITEEELEERISEESFRKTHIPSTFHALKQGALSFLLRQEDYSRLELGVDERVIGRELQKGAGLKTDLQTTNAEWEKLLFIEYLLDYTGNYVSPREDGYLKYQTEYLLTGCEIDGENLWETAERLIQLRTSANLIGILADEYRSGTVKELSLSLASALGNPEAEPVIYAALLLIWAEIEGIYDVRNLLEGRGVSLLKTSEQWLVDVTWIAGVAKIAEQVQAGESTGAASSYEEPADIFTLKEQTEGEAKQETLYYKDYLRILLWFQESEIMALRFMDIVESDIREVTGQSTFCLDEYTDRIWLTTKVSSKYEKEFQITREYGY